MNEDMNDVKFFEVFGKRVCIWKELIQRYEDVFDVVNERELEYLAETEGCTADSSEKELQKAEALFQNGRLYSLGTGKTREFYILCNAAGDISMSLSETDYRPSVKSPAYIREHGTALSSLQELACL